MFSFLKKNKGWVAYFSCLLLIVFLFRFVFMLAFIPSESMVPTLNVKDILFCSCMDQDYDRYDIIVFQSPDQPSILYIKRIIGLPGDVVDIVDGTVYINGEQAEDSFIAPEISHYTGKFEVPEHSYFVMGDNRNHSNDSRYWQTTHFVPEENIKAVALFRILPLSRIGGLK